MRTLPTPDYLRVPLSTKWPKGFTTDYVTVFPDTPVLWAGDWTRPWTWLRFARVDLRPAAWWHDLRYWAGWNVPTWWDLPALTPKPLDARTEIQRELIDYCFVRDAIASGVHPRTAETLAAGILDLFGGPHYYWNPEAAR